MKKYLCLFFTLTLAIHATFPETVDEYLDIGGQHLNEGRLHEAHSVFVEAIRLDPNHALSHFHLGVIYLHMEEPKLAQESLSRAIELDETIAEAYFWRAAVFYYHGTLSERDKALSDFNTAISLEPENTRYRIGRAVFLFETGSNLELALIDLNKAVEVEPLNHTNYQQRGFFYFKSNLSSEKALTDLDTAISLNSEDEINFYYKATVLSHLQRYQEAIENYGLAIRLNNNNFLSYFYRAQIYFDLGMYKEAERDFTELIRIAPNESSSYSNRALIYRLLAGQADNPAEAGYYRDKAYFDDQMVSRLDGRRE